MKLLKLNSA